MTDDLERVRMGVYRHYKGPLYLVIGIAHDANADALYSDRMRRKARSEQQPLGKRRVVVYVPLQLDGGQLGPRMAVRTLDDFLGFVEDPSFPEVVLRDGSTGHLQRRFRHLGPELTADAIEGRG